MLTGEKQLLLPKALFVQWVIQSDVVVAQTDNNLEIWYNIDMPEHKTLMPVRGEVTEIIRENVCLFFKLVFSSKYSKFVAIRCQL